MFELAALLEPLPQPPPRQVVGQVLGRHAAKLTVDPGLEPLVVVVDRLDVVDTLADAPVIADSHRFRGHAQRVIAATNKVEALRDGIHLIVERIERIERTDVGKSVDVLTRDIALCFIAMCPCWLHSR